MTTKGITDMPSIHEIAQNIDNAMASERHMFLSIKKCSKIRCKSVADVNTVNIALVLA